jgi:hypothetical protein
LNRIEGHPGGLRHHQVSNLPNFRPEFSGHIVSSNL